VSGRAADYEAELLAADLAFYERAGEGRFNALTTGVLCGTSCWISSADEVPGGLARGVPSRAVHGVRDVDYDLPGEPVGVPLDGSLDARVIDGEDNNVAAPVRARSQSRPASRNR